MKYYRTSKEDGRKEEFSREYVATKLGYHYDNVEEVMKSVEAGQPAQTPWSWYSVEKE